MKNSLKFLLRFLLLNITFSAIAWANEINLYEQPKTEAKVVGKIDLSAGVIPIFTPKGDWIKVADPQNGNVGWIKSTDLNAGTGNSTVTFTQRIINNGKGPSSYQVIEFGQPGKKLTDKEAQEMTKRIELQRQTIQQSAQKVINDMVNEMNRFYQQHWNLMNNFGSLPVIMPIVIIPSQKLSPPNQTNPAKAKEQPQADPAIKK